MKSDTQQQSSSRHRSEKFDMSQCFSCKQFGHTLTHCRLLPRVLAIMQFHSKHVVKCNKILKQYIHSNTIDSKRVFVRTLQNINFLPHTYFSDSYLENDMIVHTLTDNGFEHNDFNSEEE